MKNTRRARKIPEYQGSKPKDQVTMVEIYSYDINTHERYAHDQQEIEAFRKQYHLPPSSAGTIAAQTRVLDFIPKHPAIVLLMQTFQKTTWGRFTVPKNYYTQRLASSYVAPSLGSAERQDADIHKVESFLKSKRKKITPIKDKEEERERDEEDEQHGFLFEEGEAIIQLLDLGIKKTNQEIDFIISRMHQFVQA